MTDAQIRAMRKFWDVSNDVREYSAFDFECRAVSTRRNKTNTVATDPDGTKWRWSDERNLWVRTI